jgi:hypothetical protein
MVKPAGKPSFFPGRFEMAFLVSGQTAGFEVFSMLSVHPLLQFSMLLLGGYVLFLGLFRAMSLHGGHRTLFRWRRHVALGHLAMAGWLMGLAGGLIMVRITWHSFLISGLHGRIALAMIPFILFGWASGYWMDRTKKKRTLLPLLHGLNNLLVLLAALAQIYTGYRVFQTFVLGQ